MSVELTAQIVAAYAGQNNIAVADLPAFIQSVHSALANLGQPVAEAVEAPTKATPAQIRKSITETGLISFEDGKTYKTLKRRLRTAHNLSPQEYRAKWGLPKDYPMVSPAYSAQRSALAKSLGLGQLNRKAPAAPAVITAPVARGRKPKAAAK